MIRAVCPDAVSDLKTGFVTGWNVAPNIAYTITVVPGASSCAVWLFDAGTGAYLAGGAALVGTDQPVTLLPATSPGIGMVDADLGYHLLVTTDGTEDAQTYGIGPFVDGQDQLSAIYTMDNLAVVQATAVIRDGTHYTDDASIMCPLGFDGVLGGVVSATVHGAAIVGDVESISFSASPSRMADVITVRSMSAILPDAPVVIVPPNVADDTAETDAATATSGNVLTNDSSGLTVVAVDGIAANVGVAVPGSNGGVFAIAADGSWTLDPGGDFATLSGSDTAETSVTYHASNGSAEASATVTVTVIAVPDSADMLWPYVALCINPDGADGGTLITDARGAVLTVGSGIAIDTDALGTPAILNTGSNALTTFGTSWLPQGTEDFCVEAYISKTVATNGYEFLFDTTTTGGMQLYFGSTQGQIRLSRTGVDYQASIPLSSIAIGTLYHFAVTRQGTAVKMWIDGVQVASVTSSVSYSAPGNQRLLASMKALCRGLRVTRGHYRYSDTFTPPSLPFPTT